MSRFNTHEWNRKRRLAEDNVLEGEKREVLQDIVDYATTNYLNIDTLTSDMLDGIIDYCQQLKVSDY